MSNVNTENKNEFEASNKLFNLEQMGEACDTLARLGSLMMKFCKEPEFAVNEDDDVDDSDCEDTPPLVLENSITPAYKAAVDGELAVLRAQLYTSGLFKKIECVKLIP